MSSVFYRNASAALLVYDITDPKSFTNTSNWLRQIRSYSSDAVILLVGKSVAVLQDQLLCFSGSGMTEYVLNS